MLPAVSSSPAGDIPAPALLLGATSPAAVLEGVDRRELAIGVLEYAKDAAGGVAGFIELDVSRHALVIDVVAVLQRLDCLGQLLPGVLVPGRISDLRKGRGHLLAVRRARCDRRQVTQNHVVEILPVVR